MALVNADDGDGAEAAARRRERRGGRWRGPVAEAARPKMAAPGEEDGGATADPGAVETREEDAAEGPGE